MQPGSNREGEFDAIKTDDTFNINALWGKNEQLISLSKKLQDALIGPYKICFNLWAFSFFFSILIYVNPFLLPLTLILPKTVFLM